MVFKERRRIDYLVVGRLELLDAALVQADADLLPRQPVGARGRRHDEGDACRCVCYVRRCMRKHNPRSTEVHPRLVHKCVIKHTKKGLEVEVSPAGRHPAEPEANPAYIVVLLW